MRNDIQRALREGLGISEAELGSSSELYEHMNMFSDNPNGNLLADVIADWSYYGRLRRSLDAVSSLKVSE